MPNIPQWAGRFRKKGTTIRESKGRLLMYTCASERVPGKRYPVARQRYVGYVTEEGVFENFTINVVSSGIRWWEYGFSKALEHIAQGSAFMKDLGGEERARKVLCRIITTLSPSSYLAREGDGWCSGLEGTNISYQARKLERMCPCSFEEMGMLKDIHLLEIGGRLVTTAVNEEQKRMLDGMGVELEWQV